MSVIFLQTVCKAFYLIPYLLISSTTRNLLFNDNFNFGNYISKMLTLGSDVLFCEKTLNKTGKCRVEIFIMDSLWDPQIYFWVVPFSFDFSRHVFINLFFHNADHFQRILWNFFFVCGKKSPSFKQNLMHVHCHCNDCTIHKLNELHFTVENIWFCMRNKVAPY